MQTFEIMQNSVILKFFKTRSTDFTDPNSGDNSGSF
jgi:hypothetical protein